MPDFKQSIINKEIKIDTLLKIRESRECQDFRTWLWDIDSKTDIEIKEAVQSYNSLVSKSLTSKSFRTIKYIGNSILGNALSAGIGAAIEPLLTGQITPLSIVNGLIISYGISTASSYAAESTTDKIQEKVLPYNEPLLFLNNSIPSIFNN